MLTLETVCYGVLSKVAFLWIQLGNIRYEDDHLSQLGWPNKGLCVDPFDKVIQCPTLEFWLKGLGAT